MSAIPCGSLPQPREIYFWVDGNAIPKGSARAFVFGGRAVVTHDNKRTKPWQRTVAEAARAAVQRWKLDGVYRVDLAFNLERPKSHFTSTGKLTKAAPAEPTLQRVGDLDKLERTVLDALTGILWEDDSQVVEIHSQKRWAGGSPGVAVTVINRSVAVAA